MSEGNTAHMDGDLRCYLERVKTVKNERYSTSSPLYRAYNHRFSIPYRDCVPPVFKGTLRIVLVNTFLLKICRVSCTVVPCKIWVNSALRIICCKRSVVYEGKQCGDVVNVVAVTGSLLSFPLLEAFWGYQNIL